MSELLPIEFYELNDRIRRRARELCEEYNMPGREGTMVRKLRSDFKRRFGCAVRDLNRDSMPDARDYIATWENTHMIYEVYTGRD